MAQEKPKCRLLADRILVKVAPRETKTASGIIIPDSVTQQDTCLTGEVVTVSKKIAECEVEEDKVNVGETILFSTYSGSELEGKWKGYRIMRITDVMTVLED